MVRVVQRGPGDTDPENAMVIPTLLMRIHRREDPVSLGRRHGDPRFRLQPRRRRGALLALHHGTHGSDVNPAAGRASRFVS